MTTTTKALITSGASALAIGTIHTIAHNLGTETIGVTVIITAAVFLIGFWGMTR